VLTRVGEICFYYETPVDIVAGGKLVRYWGDGNFFGASEIASLCTHTHYT